MTRRTRAREVALQLLFQRDHNPNIPRADIERFAADRLRDEKLQAFCLSLVDGVLANQADIDQKLAAFEIVLERTAKTVAAGREKLRATPPPPSSANADALGALTEEATGDFSEAFFDQDSS